MFLLDGKPLALDAPFTHDGIQYPANWLRLASPEEREAIGITEVPDPQPYDQRFYWGYDTDGNLIPKDHDGLVELWTSTTRTTAGTLLTPTDWFIIRELDNGSAMPADIKTWRQALREACNEKVAAITATKDTDDLAVYITAAEYSAWPVDPTQPVPEAPPASAPTDGTTSAGVA